MRRVGLILIIVLTIAAAPAGAQRLFGTIGAGGGTSTLVELNPTTGAVVTTIGDVGYLVNGMAWDYSTGTLYATTSYHDASFPTGLMTINPATAAGTPIGTGFGLPGEGRSAPVLTAVNSAGQVYSWWDPNEDDLILFDTATGLATRVGESGIGTGGHGLAFDGSDVLWVVQRGPLYTINTTTGAATATGGSIGVQAHHGQFHPTTGLYYGIDGTGSGPNDIIVADFSTATVVNTIPTVDGLHTLAFVDGTFAQQGIPTISPWGAGIMALLVLVCGAMVLRRYV